jgi:hypothetical protein
MKKGGGCLIDFISDKCFPGTGRVGGGLPPSEGNRSLHEK